MKLLVIDGNSILSRAFYGIRPLTTKEGLHTNGIYGFMNILTKLIDEIKPDSCAVAFDLPKPTFRHKQFEGYKAGRKPMPDELREQVPVLKELLDKYGISRLEAEGFEADDILGTLANTCKNNGDECYIATGDRDSLQLVSNSTSVLLATTKAGRPETNVYDPQKIQEVYQIEPLALIEVKALMGDASDRIPGVAGIGEKTALSLIQKYKTVNEIYTNIDTLDIRDSVRKKLVDGKDSAMMSLDLARIHTDAPITTDIKELEIKSPDKNQLLEILKRLEFYKMIDKLDLNNGDVSSSVDNVEKATYKASLCSDLPALFERIKTDKECYLSCVFDEQVAVICFAFENEIVIVSKEAQKDFDNFIKNLMTAKDIKKRTHDIKLLHSACLNSGYSLSGDDFDAMLAGYILDPLSNSYALDRLSDAYSVGDFAVECPFGTLDDTVACCKNAVIIRKLYPIMIEKLKENNQTKLFYDIELPLAGVLADMEVTGFLVDATGIKEYGEKLKIKLKEIEKEIFSITGYEFNINSPKQLGEALFIKLGLPPKKKTKTGFSTNVDVLEALRKYNPVVGMVLEYRQLSKLISTYTDGLLKVIGKDGRIHSSFNQVETRTGRISSTEPNLQNIPIRSEVGKELRKFFIANENSILIDADYSQIELRILADISGDKVMQEAFNTGEDIHTLTASQVFNMPINMVTPLMRSHAKAVNFGIVYGISAFSLSEDINVSVKEADSYIKGYLEKFSGVREYMEKVIKDAHDKGYVETLLGRRRNLPELTSSNHNIRSFGERVARNTPIQGTAADIIKIAMIKVENRLKKENLKSKLILQVHDELIVEAPLSEKEQAKKILKEEMENAMSLSVKLDSDVNCGDNWFTAH